MDLCQIPYAQTGLQSCNHTSMYTICKAVASKLSFVTKQGKKVSRQLTIKHLFPVFPIYIRKSNHILINKNHDCFPNLLQDPAHKTRGGKQGNQTYLSKSGSRYRISSTSSSGLVWCTGHCFAALKESSIA